MRMMHTYMGLLLLALLPVIAPCDLAAQNDKKAAQKAERYFTNADFDRAADLYSALSQSHPQNLDYSYHAGISWFYSVNTANKTKAIPYLEAAVTAMGTDTVPEIYYYLGQTYHLANRFDDAINAYGHLRHFIETLSGDTVDLNEIKHYMEMCSNAKELVKHPVNVQIENLGDNVNSSAPDYAPTLPADGSQLIFTSRREGTTGGKKDDDGIYYEDIYFSKKSGSSWDAAQNAGEGVNSKKHDASVAVSRDGKRLYLYRANDIWVSGFESGAWTKPVKLLPDVNSKSYEPSVTISDDEGTIYFVSERKGGYGGKDIYRSVKQADGKWSTAQNLGPGVNTPFDEDSPFIDTGGKTLYFSSQGHNSMGGFDVFSARLENETWSKAVNLGYPINTAWDNIFYVTRQEDRSYYATVREDTRGDLDIYVISPVKRKHGVKLVLITKNSSTNAPAHSYIALESASSRYESDLELGVEHFDSLVPGQKYTLTVSMQGFKTKSIQFTLPGQGEDEEFYQEVYFEPLKDEKGEAIGQKTTIYNAFFDIEEEAEKTGSTASNLDAYSAFVRKIDTTGTKLNFKVYRLIDRDGGALASGSNKDSLNTGNSNTNTAQGWAGARDSTSFAAILFDYGRPVLREDAQAELLKLYQLMSSDKSLKLEIHGHTDSEGTDAYNMSLSLQRANAVALWLKQKGIPASRIKVSGYGSIRPVASNKLPDGTDNPGGRQKNRRVELIVVSPR
jgi:outer membrane protein OmpA-like peptidoglycan-associated protein/tetratricopeptide (TPR) repeat protein